MTLQTRCADQHVLRVKVIFPRYDSLLPLKIKQFLGEMFPLRVQRQHQCRWVIQHAKAPFLTACVLIKRSERTLHVPHFQVAVVRATGDRCLLVWHLNEQQI